MFSSNVETSGFSSRCSDSCCAGSVVQSVSDGGEESGVSPVRLENSSGGWYSSLCTVAREPLLARLA